MITSYLPCHPAQLRLMPDALQDWLPEGHLAYFISDAVDQLDLSAFHKRYAKGGLMRQNHNAASTSATCSKASSLYAKTSYDCKTAFKHVVFSIKKFS